MVRAALIAGSLLAVCAAPALAQTPSYGITIGTHTAGTTSATAGTFTQALPLVGGVYQRRSCFVTNTGTNNLLVDVGPTPTTATARVVTPNNSYSCTDPSGNTSLDQVWVSSATASQPYNVWTFQ